MGGTRIVPTILALFEQHPTQVLTIERLLKVTGYKRSSVQAAISRMQESVPALQTVVQGRAWIYHPGSHVDAPAKTAEQPAPTQVEVRNAVSAYPPELTPSGRYNTLTVLDNGDLLLQDEETRIVYRATPIK